MFPMLPLLLLFRMVLNLKKSAKAKFLKLPVLPLFRALLILEESSLRSMFPMLPLLLLFRMVLNVKKSAKAKFLKLPVLPLFRALLMREREVYYLWCSGYNKSKHKNSQKLFVELQLDNKVLILGSVVFAYRLQESFLASLYLQDSLQYFLQIWFQSDVFSCWFGTYSSSFNV